MPIVKVPALLSTLPIESKSAIHFCFLSVMLHRPRSVVIETYNAPSGKRDLNVQFA